MKNRIIVTVILIVILCGCFSQGAFAEYGAGALIQPSVSVKEKIDENGELVLHLKATVKSGYEFQSIVCVETALEKNDEGEYVCQTYPFADYLDRAVFFDEQEVYFKPRRNATYIFGVGAVRKGVYKIHFYKYLHKGYISVDSLPEYYDGEGVEMSIASDEGVVARIDGTLKEESKIFAALWNENGDVIGVHEVSDRLEKSDVGDGLKRYSGEIRFEENGISAVKLYLWNNDLEPLSDSKAVSVAEADVEISSLDTEVRVSGDKYADLKVYGPLLAYSEETENVRYFKTFEECHESVDGAVMIAVSGRYLAVAQDENGVEYHKFFDVENAVEE